jgi:hypothetical protein
MFAIPSQTMEIWRATLNEAMAMQSEHLSSYEVIYEDDTPLFEQLKAGEFSVNENLACEMYEELIAHAVNGGFHQYEIANFARDAKSINPSIHQSITPLFDDSPQPSLAQIQECFDADGHARVRDFGRRTAGIGLLSPGEGRLQFDELGFLHPIAEARW